MTHPTKEKPVDVNNPNRDESDTFYAYFLWLRKKNLDRFHVKINPEISRNLTKWIKHLFNLEILNEKLKVTWIIINESYQIGNSGVPESMA